MDEKLLEFCRTDRQREILLALFKYGTERAAAKALKVAKSRVSKVKRAVSENAVRHGYSPDYDLIHPVPNPLVLKGTSTLYDGDGNTRLQWVKTNVDEDLKTEAIEEAVKALVEPIKPAESTKAPPRTNKALCNLYTFSDFHMGMLAWGVETGADWDLKIAKRVLSESFVQMVNHAPDADTALICILGDFLHSDGLEPLTPTSGHVVDVSSRFSEIVAASILVLRSLIDTALQRHARVELVVAEGNHDLVSSLWLRHMFLALYDNEPRLTVNESELPYYVHQHGQTMLCFHHGHMKKPSDLPMLFAAQFPEVWGATKHRYAHCGHRHHVNVKETAGIVVTQHPTLASRDAYSARHGYVASRRALCVTYHDKYGKVAEYQVTPEMVMDTAS